MKQKLRPLEVFMNLLFFVCGLIAVVFVLFISIYLIVSGLPAIREIGLVDFLFGTEWASTAAEPKFGILPFILTSIYGTAGAIVLGVPVGFMTAVFLAKVAPPRLASLVRPAVDLLAGIPSVVYGLIGMMVLVPAVRVAFHLPDAVSYSGSAKWNVENNDSDSYNNLDDFCMEYYDPETKSSRS